MERETPQRINRRGCLVVAVGVALVLLILAAIGLGWVGQVDRGKITDLPVPAENQG
jgi:hypothetical protein